MENIEYLDLEIKTKNLSLKLANTLDEATSGMSDFERIKISHLALSDLIIRLFHNICDNKEEMIDLNKKFFEFLNNEIEIIFKYFN